MRAAWISLLRALMAPAIVAMFAIPFCVPVMGQTADAPVRPRLTIAANSPEAAPVAEHIRQGMVSDWTARHLLFPEVKDESVMRRVQSDPRWLRNWYGRHPVWGAPPRRVVRHSHRDWTVPLGTASFGSIFDFSFNLGVETANGTLNTVDEGGGEFLATGGSLTVTAGADVGTFPLYPGGPGVTLSPSGGFLYDNVVYAQENPALDIDGLLFTGTNLEINVWGTGPNTYSFFDYSDGSYGTQLNGTGSFSQQIDPGGGQVFPSKYTFDVNLAPNCTSDYVALGIPALPAAGGQANIVGVNNLYSGTTGAACTGPTVIFAYASGTGEVPASVAISLDGTQIAYVENVPGGSSYFHILTLGTTGNNGTSATDAVVPGNGNNAVDQKVLLSPDGGTTNQGSTNAPWVVYATGENNDVAYVTTYSSASNSGYLYKISNVFSGGAPTIVWSVAIDAIPSTPVYDSVSNKIFFTDSNGLIDYVLDSGTPTVVYGPVPLAPGTTSENPVIVDSTHQMVYATFDSNGTNALVAQTPTDLSSAVLVAVGPANTLYAAPYEPDFNYAWYTGSGTPLMYVAGTGTGSVPTLYSIGFNGSGVLNATANATTAALATGTADSSPVTEFYNATLGKDYIFVGVTNNCVATSGGTGGCVMSLDITSGFPSVGAGSTALSASGGTSGIVVDNNSSATEASSIYYMTKSGNTLVKATQSALQ